MSLQGQNLQGQGSIQQVPFGHVHHTEKDPLNSQQQLAQENAANLACSQCYEESHGYVDQQDGAQGVRNKDRGLQQVPFGHVHHTEKDLLNSQQRTIE